MRHARRLALAWTRATLATRFALAGGTVLLLAALLIGALVSARIERSVVRNAAATTALYLDSFLAPFGEELARGAPRSPAAARALDEILAQSAVGLKVVSYKIWHAGGKIVAASDPELVGRSFSPSADLRQAWSGKVAASFDDTGDEEDAHERGLGLPLLEIYSPIRADWSGEIVAVAELYVADPALRADLVASRRWSWIGIAGGGLVLGLMLYAIVRQGSSTIERQRQALDLQLVALGAMAARNDTLRLRVQEAAAGAATATEQALRRVSADLHDGPAQYLAYAQLRLGALRPASGAEAELAAVDAALRQAMSEIRGISRGLALPDIAGKPLETVVRMAVEAHRALSGQAVALELSGTPPASLPGVAAPALRICLYRFVQEGLNNASRHAGGLALQVRLVAGGQGLALSVSDGGPGIAAVPDAPGPDSAPPAGLGLAGLRHRVESLGGRFGLRPAMPGPGVTLWMEIGEDR